MWISDLRRSNPLARHFEWSMLSIRLIVGALISQEKVFYGHIQISVSISNCCWCPVGNYRGRNIDNYMLYISICWTCVVKPGQFGERSWLTIQGSPCLGLIWIYFQSFIVISDDTFKPGYSYALLCYAIRFPKVFDYLKFIPAYLERPHSLSTFLRHSENRM